jgi:Kef-type K+ transport system membrane component KefB
VVDTITQVFAVLFAGSILGWLSKRLLYNSFIGYVVGGFITSSLLANLGLGAPNRPGSSF